MTDQLEALHPDQIIGPSIGPGTEEERVYRELWKTAQLEISQIKWGHAVQVEALRKQIQQMREDQHQPRADLCPDCGEPAKLCPDTGTVQIDREDLQSLLDTHDRPANPVTTRLRAALEEVTNG